MNEEMATHPALEMFLDLKLKAQWVAALSAKEYRIFDSWTRKGLHTCWGMHRVNTNDLYHQKYWLMGMSMRRDYTMIVPLDMYPDLDDHAENLANYFESVSMALDEANYPLEDDWNQNDAHRQ